MGEMSWGGGQGAMKFNPCAYEPPLFGVGYFFSVGPAKINSPTIGSVRVQSYVERYWRSPPVVKNRERAHLVTSGRFGKLIELFPRICR